MTRITWDDTGKRLYETGTDRGVLFPTITEGASAGDYGAGVPWNGLTNVNETPSGAEETALYADNSKYLALYSQEEYGGTIEAYTYPDEFAECDGSKEVVPGVTIGQQSRKRFGFSYRTLLGNDVQGNDYGYKIHLVYGAMASPSEKAYETINDSPAAMTMSWDFSTVPVYAGENYKKTSLIVVDSTKVAADRLTALEAVLYGSENTQPRLPLPEEVYSIINGNTNGSTGSTGETGETGETGDTGSTGSTTTEPAEPSNP